MGGKSGGEVGSTTGEDCGAASGAKSIGVEMGVGSIGALIGTATGVGIVVGGETVTGIEEGLRMSTVFRRSIAWIAIVTTTKKEEIGVLERGQSQSTSNETLKRRNQGKRKNKNKRVFLR